MKTKIFLFVFLCFIAQVYSQDREARPMNFVWGNNNTSRPLQVDSFPQNNFLTGFQWIGSGRFNHALLNNASASSYLYWTDKSTDSNFLYTSKRYLMDQVGYILSNDTTKTIYASYSPGIRNAPAMVYEPTLELDSNNIDFTGRLF